MALHPPTAPAVVLLSGGLDSAVTAAIARREGHALVALSFDYGQRHRHELATAAAVARSLGALRHIVLPLDLRAIGGSALTADIAVPKDRPAETISSAIPITYVPARNLTFLAIAAGLAETVGARDIYLGVNAVDYSGYPDCRPAFIEAFERCANLGTKAGVEHPSTLHTPDPYLRVRAPLITLTKAQIIRAGADLGVDLSLTTSCYDPVESRGQWLACGRCDACHLRRAGFQAAGIPDPTNYQASLP